MQLPGAGLSIFTTTTYLVVFLLGPIVALLMKASTVGLDSFLEMSTAPRTLAALGLSFGAAALAAMIDVVLGFVIAYVLERYEFRGRSILDALVDLPFALPTAVAGISLAFLYSTRGWIGSFLAPLGIEVAFTRLGVLLALVFVGLPLAVRTLQPLLAAQDPQIEEAAKSLGASKAFYFWRVLLPQLRTGLFASFALAFARCVGEYGSVIFISGNLPLKTEIAPQIIVGKLEQFDYAGASALAVVMMFTSVVLLITIHALSKRAGRAKA